MSAENARDPAAFSGPVTRDNFARDITGDDRAYEVGEQCIRPFDETKQPGGVVFCPPSLKRGREDFFLHFYDMVFLPVNPRLKRRKQ